IALLPETKPEQAADKPEESFQETLVGYTAVLRDNIFMVYIFLSILVTIVYVQMNSTMAVYLRDSHGIPAQGYGYILSLNAGMVVLFQFWITRKISHLPPLLVIAAGVALYAVGFAMYGVVAGFVLFAVGMVIITIGEMLILPVAQALTAQFAPEDMRGRYMAMYGFSWTIPFAIGPLLGGMIMDAGYADWVWYASGILGLGATLGFVWLHTAVGGKLRPADAAQVPAD
ncbi:MAG: MFS transporter, partial [Anaerolineae bacterium]